MLHNRCRSGQKKWHRRAARNFRRNWTSARPVTPAWRPRRKSNARINLRFRWPSRSLGDAGRTPMPRAPAGAQNGGTQGAQSQGTRNPGNASATARAQTPVRRPTTSAPASTPTPSSRTSPTPGTTDAAVIAGNRLPLAPPATTTSADPGARRLRRMQRLNRRCRRTPTQTVGRPTPDEPDRNVPTNNSVNNRINNQQRIPPASRGVGTTTTARIVPKCVAWRSQSVSVAIPSRDDLPAGVTTTQPEK